MREGEGGRHVEYPPPRATSSWPRHGPTRPPTFLRPVPLPSDTSHRPGRCEVPRIAPRAYDNPLSHLLAEAHGA
jgi:hypothetical protein